MGTSWAASLAVVILAALTGSNGYTSAPVGRSVRAIPESKMSSADKDKQFEMLKIETSALFDERLQDNAKMQNLTHELESALHIVDELTQKEKFLNEKVERLSQENEYLKVQLADKDAKVQSLSRQLNQTFEKLEASTDKEMPFNTTVQNQNGNRNDTLMTSEASSDTHMSLNNSLNVYYRNKDWEELKLNLERILDRKSVAYHQLETVSYDHGYPLWRIGGYCQESLAEVLMSGVQGPNISESDGDMMLHGAAQGGCEDLINTMLDRGADIEARDNGGATSLVIASRYGLMRTVRLLKERGADVNAADNKGETGLHLAAQGNHLVVVKYLVKTGANVNARDKDGSTPLRSAIMRGRTVVAVFLSTVAQSRHTEEVTWNREGTLETFNYSSTTAATIWSD